jgi:hypothetical protein
MMARILIATIIFGGLAVAQTPRTPILVELFTSEGCSSCPPADAVLTRLDKEQPVSSAEVIVLSEHIDYWNDLGWKDPFSSPLFSARQQDYGQAMRLKEVYTPQMIVNGQTQIIGSDWDAANKAIRAAAQLPKADVRISNRGSDVAGFEVRSLPAGTKTAQMFFAITESGVGNLVAGGENDGHRLTHTGVVRSLHTLGTLDVSSKRGAYTGEARVTTRPEWNRRNVKVILFVQDRDTKRILGAASVRLN